MSGEPYTRTMISLNFLTSNLVSEPLGLNNSDVINDTLVDVEVIGKPREDKTFHCITFRSTFR